MRSHYDVLVVGSGAGGGVVAARLAEAGRDVGLVESGSYHLAGSFTRWELAAVKQLWNAPRFAMTSADGSRPVAMVSGKGVGGSTNINTKVAIRAVAQDYVKWFEATGLLGEGGAPFSADNLAPWYERVERRMGVRVRADWTGGVRLVERGFNALGHTLHPVTSYTNFDCERCGSCTSGCPTNAGGTTLNRYISKASALGRLDIVADTRVTGVLTAAKEGGRREATGVVAEGPDGSSRTVDAPIVIVAAGALVTPQLLQLSGLHRLGTPSSALIGKTLGTHTARMVHGRFPDVVDAHVVYPITAHCSDFANDDAGGFVVEAITVLDPMALASLLVDEAFAPLYGRRLVDTMNSYRYLAGLFMMTNDSNVGVVEASDDMSGVFTLRMPPEDEDRLENAHAFCSAVLGAAGSLDIVSTGFLTSHVQGSARMGSDPERSACNSHQRLWDVEGLYVGDASVIPRTLTFNPSLTIMALAERLAAHVHEDVEGRLPAPRVGP